MSIACGVQQQSVICSSESQKGVVRPSLTICTWHVSRCQCKLHSLDLVIDSYHVHQVLEPGPSQLAAAVVALVSTLVARAKDSSGLLWLAWQASFAHWALEACVIAEAERLTGTQATTARFSNMCKLVCLMSHCDRSNYHSTTQALHCASCTCKQTWRFAPGRCTVSANLIA